MNFFHENIGVNLKNNIRPISRKNRQKTLNFINKNKPEKLQKKPVKIKFYSTVTDLAKLRGLSGLRPNNLVTR